MCGKVSAGCVASFQKVETLGGEIPGMQEALSDF